MVKCDMCNKKMKGNEQVYSIAGKPLCDKCLSLVKKND